MGGWVASCKGGAPAAVRLCEGAVLSVILLERKCDRQSRRPGRISSHGCTGGSHAVSRTMERLVFDTILIW
jgi:hypothetical protein